MTHTIPHAAFHCEIAAGVLQILPMILQVFIIGHEERMKIITKMNREFWRFQPGGCASYLSQAIGREPDPMESGLRPALPEEGSGQK